MSKEIHVIAAMCNNRGIGCKQNLPWRLKKELAYFTNISSTTVNPELELLENQNIDIAASLSNTCNTIITSPHIDLQNAVIMGRKTWESIPKKFQPLDNRVNVVITRSSKDEWKNDDCIIANSYEAAIDVCNANPKVESIFITGGNKIYEMAVQSHNVSKIYLTRILADFECDTFFPTFDESLYVKTSKDVINTEKGLDYIYDVFQKI